MKHNHNIDTMFSLLERIDPQYRQYRSLITEADQGVIKARDVIEQVFGGKLNLDGVVTEPAYYVNDNPQTTWRQYILYNLRHTFGLMANNASKYLPTVAKLAYSDAVRFDLTNDNSAEVRTLQRIVDELKRDQKLFQGVREELNKEGASPSDVFNELRDAFSEKFKQADEKDTAEANSVEDNGSNYTVVEVPDFKTAKYYGDHSCSESKLCYTQSESTWNSYTKDGVNAVYVCLRDGWENIPETPTEGNPYDLYGTSMIFVFVGPNGDITCSNCRWNHKTVGKYGEGGVDHAFTKASLSKTIGKPFDSVFKPKKVDIAQMIEAGGGNLRNIAVGDFVIPNGVRKIGESAFFGCTGLTSVTIPDSVTAIGDNAFSACTGLTSVTIPNSVTTIGDLAFYRCENLTSVTIPDSVTAISLGAFGGCTGLTSVTIPNSVMTIGDYSFYRCSGLTEVTIPNSVMTIGDRAFSGCSTLTVYVSDDGHAEMVRRTCFGGKIVVEG